MHEAPHDRSVEELWTAIESYDGEIALRRAESYMETRKYISEAEIVITRALDDTLLTEATELKWVQALNAGVDHYNLTHMRDRGIMLTNASGVHAFPAAEQVLAYMLLFERNLLQGIHRQRRHEWRHFGGGELSGTTVGIIGVGEIGGAVATRAAAFGMDTLGMRRNPDRSHEAIDKMLGPDRLHELLARSKYVVLTCPLTDDTRGLLGATEFESMRSDAVVVNVARGEVIDQQALAASLQNGKIGGAALDVQTPEPLPEESPLWTLSNVVITPHMAGSSPKYLDRCADIFLSNYEHYLQGEYDQFENRVV
ncbi:D-2-hydroxyacid dehydrogenase [Halorubrum sp. AD140]|uniref:D-2-hydroxyacid dehydrogenase n=1 Tax=Halorubrum sp. AD140 TaxID=3050073 RepID=UPI002ACC3DFE|nr:D-2-hydroxyacid dehydrogenase [Halorubrum sp. AD140]MDZ5811400.1 D-2-hydroxyacid dehydrogenase [Halorubrum sp. AD140]